MNQEQAEKKQKIFSILGDSVSTYAGYTPIGAVFYDGWVQQESGVLSPEDTWWMQVIRGKQGILGVNNSYAGSTVSGNLPFSGTSEIRLKDLGRKGEPDVILVNLGCNDWGFCVLPEEFETEYRKLIYSLKCLYPKAEIWCATLLRGYLEESGEDSFFNVDNCISQKIYSDIIRNIAKRADVRVADIGRYDVEYETIDGVHPNKNGMKTIARLWLKEMD